MRTRRTSAVLLAATALVLVPALVPGAAGAVDQPGPINTPPRPITAEAPPPPRKGAPAVREGLEAAANLGGGFSDNQGLGVGGRVGYTFAPGLYVGGNVTYYFGRTIATPTISESAHAFFTGAEAGYKLYPSAQTRIEVRPFVLAGPTFQKTINETRLVTTTSTTLTITPGLMVAYHFGDAYLSGEGRVNVTNPNGVSLLAGAGLSF